MRWRIVSKAPAAGQGPPALRRYSTESWFGTVASAEPRVALGVLQLAESFSIDVKPGEWSQARPTLAIIPTQSAKLVTAAKVVLAPDGMSVPGSRISRRRASVQRRGAAHPEWRAWRQ
jgi:hypothetical protein